ncbi:MAG: elongation factor 4 [Candidatus Komeilibacteria bacterium CG11_big_fil_rev_8_21_14_0_20_36_20]|uniref:Elongation factor 4 n=1 Tax=Candidatus Komeilibacteria bacterium CG11_big_fil_rev_8_21_14_0_20_36_20 TaxID=1974477 RepID=A0A2H0NBS0_9BACT|nr:MAG: elongation factor 4 [Candidatus Komeilibacteria bacterium CG11_big_fil_rev_8_21_14_0_20_36_20]PIR81475.1 MAG: elongation factor 4 [Candidatus Komeilibacteria bacterium CG10_big_fil_rev_8_21_14_0_10_36_65]PJC55676.1 MAG: elongation factor 4 [Candidatus Komeilibacteria bacterium CG_4_9_14_0_2_um_filter_36_13]
MANIRNFCIIAHIDHGKSTLADRMLEITGTVDKRKMKNQLLDQMELERERGITIKLQPARMEWDGFILNLIDTPGHVDFTYEVSRSLAAVESAVLLVDATQGVEAQTLANLYLAVEQNLEIIPVMNKIDLPAANVEKVSQEIINLLGCNKEDILLISAKTGQGVTEVLKAICQKTPAPIEENKELQALIFDSNYDEYKGVVIYIRVFGGQINKGDRIKFCATGEISEVLDLGYFKPHWVSAKELNSGEIGYLVTGLKDLEKAQVGDTIISPKSQVKPLPGYKKVKPMVYAGIFPQEGNDYHKLREAILKLKLSDASLEFEPTNSSALGFGFRCGFLGLLHLEIFQERLKREFDLSLVVTTPTVAYKLHLRNKSEMILTTPTEMPDPSHIDYIEEPYMSIEVLTPQEYLGSLMSYITEKNGSHKDTKYLNENRVILSYAIPLSSILVDFYDNIKSISSGYASLNYEFFDYRRCELVRMDILVAEHPVEALTSLVYKNRAHHVGKSIIKKLKDVLPRAQFAIKLQAAVGGKIVAAEKISAMRKDVTAKLYGGDVTRKRKLLEKQKKGKKRMAQQGKIDIPQEAYLAVLKR